MCRICISKRDAIERKPFVTAHVTSPFIRTTQQILLSILVTVNLDKIYTKLDLIGWRVLDLTANLFLDVDLIWPQSGLMCILDLCD